MKANNVSIDMIRFYARVRDDNMMDFINMFIVGEEYKYWESRKDSGFRYNWIITQENEWQLVTSLNINDEKIVGHEVEKTGSYYIGLRHNMNNLRDLKSFVIEFNPNKVKIKGMLEKLLSYLWSFEMVDLAINSFDVAFDYRNMTTDDIYYLKGKYKNEKMFSYAGNKTFYIGESIKLYNKGIESKLDYDLLRYELRVKEKIKISELQEMDLKLEIPDIYLNNDNSIQEVSGIDKAVLFAIRNGFDINQLNKDYKAKIKKLICDDKLELSKEDIENCLRKYIVDLKKQLNIIVTQNIKNKTMNIENMTIEEKEMRIRKWEMELNSRIKNDDIERQQWESHLSDKI